MKTITNVGLADVNAVYAGREGDLWELVMGQQIHLGGFQSSMQLADAAGIGPGMSGVDFCCCNGAGMRVLVRFRNVASMIGVDATERVVARGRQRCEEEGLAQRIRFIVGDACRSGLPAASADFAWGEDAWCYVSDKPLLIAEAARVVKPGGVIAFTDWVEGAAALSDAEAERLLRFMKFPNLQDIDGYTRLLRDNGCTVLAAEDSGRFAPCMDLYAKMVEMQLTYDAMRILDFDMALMGSLGSEMAFLGDLGRAGKIVQGRFVARRN